MSSLADTNDQECIRRARRGEGKAFAELVRRYQERVYRFLLRLTRSPEDARDLTQETFMRAYHSLDAWKPDALFRTWLFRIARNMAVDRFRRERVVAFVELDDNAGLQDPAPGPEAAYASVQRLQQLEAALDTLPAEQREIILLREIEGMSYQDLAQILDLHIGTVKSRLARARVALLEKMQWQMERSA